MQKDITKNRLSFLTIILCFVLGAVFVVWGLNHKSPRSPEYQQSAETFSNITNSNENEPINTSKHSEDYETKKNKPYPDRAICPEKQKLESNGADTPNIIQNNSCANNASSIKDRKHTANTMLNNSISAITEQVDNQEELVLGDTKHNDQSKMSMTSHSSTANDSVSVVQDGNTCDNKTVMVQYQKDVERTRAKQAKDVYRLRMDAMEFLEK